ncbi:MAG: TIGR02281 family clan AA aspartic protease, partial [Pseudomonadales bacterium]|nr:TIGR02281 family clan AA aspartic protease [Pseudomonadales bacterium]
GGWKGTWDGTRDSGEVGERKGNNGAGAVLEGDFPRDILLGMTFLRNVEITERAGLLMLTNKL